MTAIEFAKKNGFTIAVEGDGAEREISGVYCCDLLSIVMGRAGEDNAWITVMGNINSIAVAVLSDVACIILSENMKLDKEATEKAINQDVCVLTSELPTFKIAMLLHEQL